MGTGGMGTVHRARMVGPAGASKQVALKLIHEHLAQDDDFVLMFLDEMRLAMGLSHRNIVQTFDAEQEEGRYYMVMELVLGRSLREVIDWHGPLPVDIALFVAREVSAALDYAHRYQPEGPLPRGLIHRDVSPGNILLSTEGDVKLTDFGVAKAAGRLYVTQVNLVRGKSQYMSPEQAAGQAVPASDLFSLGGVLYEMLTARPIRSGGLMNHLMLVTPPPPPRSLRPELSPALEALVMRCLDPEVHNRPASAEELRRALASEATRLQLRSTLAADPHLRLREFLMQQDAPDVPPPVPSHGGAPEVVFPAVPVETDPELAGLAPVTDPAARHVTNPAAEHVTDPVAEHVTDPIRSSATELVLAVPPAGRRPTSWVLPLAAGLALLAVAGALFWSIAYHDQAKPTRSDSGMQANVEPRRQALDVISPPDITPSMDAMAPPADAARRRPAQVKLRRPVGLGTLHVNSIPFSVVYLDGKSLGETPVQDVPVRAGVHTLRLVSAARGLTRTYQVTIVEGQSTRRVFRLETARPEQP